VASRFCADAQDAKQQRYSDQELKLSNCFRKWT